MLAKTITIRKPNNVLIQVPSFVIRNWALTENDTLEVYYEKEKLIIVPRRGQTTNRSI